MTPEPTVQAEIDGETALLEAIPEIVTKKVHYRSYSLKPRDIFDIAASGKCYANEVAAALRSYPASVTQALTTIEKLNPDFVSRAIAQLAVKEPYRPIANTAIERSKEILRSV